MAIACPQRDNLAQKRFDERYISTAEIARECKVSRVSVMRARKRGLLPEGIVIGTTVVFDRDAARPKIDAWKIVLAAREGNTE